MPFISFGDVVNGLVDAFLGVDHNAVADAASNRHVGALSQSSYEAAQRGEMDKYNNVYFVDSHFDASQVDGSGIAFDCHE